MDKPISLLRMEFLNNLSNLINKSKLPVFMVNDILSNILYEIKKLTDEQLKKDIEEYNAKQAEKTEKNNTIEQETVTE